MIRAEYERRLRGNSKASVARQLGINAATVSVLLNGKYPMTDYYRRKFAELYQIDPAEVDAIVHAETVTSEACGV